MTQLLLTLNRGFADIRAYRPSKYPGIVVLRLSRQGKTTVLRATRRLLDVFETNPVAQKLWIVEERRICVRG